MTPAPVGPGNLSPMKTPLLVLLFAALFAPCSLGADANELLRQGLFEEEANRNPAKAAAAYTEVVAHYDGERKIAATAMFRLAEIRSKAGDKTAATALYQRLLAEFPDGDPLARLSRDRLGALGVPVAPAPDAAPDLPTDNEEQELARFHRHPDFKAADFNSPLGDPPYRAQTPMIYAASKGWTKLLAYMIDQGAWVDDGRLTGTPLRTAAANGSKAAVELLLAHGADVNKAEEDGWTVLHAACLGRNRDIVTLLLEKGANPEAYTSRKGDNELIALALWTPDLPPDLSAWKSFPVGTPLLLAIRQNAVDIMTDLLDHGASLDADAKLPKDAIRSFPLIFALRTGREAAAQLLLTRDARTDAGGETALNAATAGAPGLVADLLRRGAAMDPDLEGRTPLFNCILAGSNSRVVSGHFLPAAWATRFAAYRKAWEALIAAGSDINARDKQKRVALHYVMPDADHPKEAADWLLAHGADMNAQDERKQTPFHLFCNKYFHAPLTDEFKTLIAWCIEHGADTDLKDVQGETPFIVSGREKVRTLDQEFRYPQIIPRYVRDRIVTALINRDPRRYGDSTVRLAPAGELDAPPSLAVLFSQAGRLACALETISIHRVNIAGGESEIARIPINHRSAPPDMSKWPVLRWGDVVLFLADGDGQASDAEQGRWRAALDKSIFESSRSVSIVIGERRATLKLAQPVVYPRLPDDPTREDTAQAGAQPVYPWNPAAETLPWWTISEFVLHLTEGEPRARLDDIRVERATEGKTQSWALDLRAPSSAEAELGWNRQPSSVKRMPSRLADGDRLIIPLASAADPQALAARRSAIRFGSRDLLFTQPVFAWRQEQMGARTLGELLMQAYLHPSMIPAVPDFSKIIIHRLKGDGGEDEALPIDLAQSIAALDLTAPAENARKADVPLQWGDTVEIRATPGGAEPWKGFDAATRAFLDNALSRNIDWTMNGRLNPAVRIRPVFGLSWETPQNLGSRFFPGVPLADPGTGIVLAESPPFTASAFLSALKINADNIVHFTLRVGDDERQYDSAELKDLNPWLPPDSKVEIQQFTP